MKLKGKQTEFILIVFLPWFVAEDHSTLAALKLITLFLKVLKFSKNKIKFTQRMKFCEEKNRKYFEMFFNIIIFLKCSFQMK